MWEKLVSDDPPQAFLMWSTILAPVLDSVVLSSAAAAQVDAMFEVRFEAAQKIRPTSGLP